MGKSEDEIKKMVKEAKAKSPISPMWLGKPTANNTTHLLFTDTGLSQVSSVSSSSADSSSRSSRDCSETE